MSLIKFKNRNSLFPWTHDSLNNFFNADDFLNTDFFEENSLLPAMNVKENDDGFDIEFAVPGFSKEDFQITIDNDILNVSSEKENKSEESEKNYTRKEFNYSSFKRSLKLPKSVNLEQEVKASYKDGILKLNLKKREEVEESPQKVIEVTG